jgi:[lysine-biosynthesis-protein LysW]---L-2-aminoadipate ligase
VLAQLLPKEAPLGEETLTIGILASRIRVEEKLLLAACATRGIAAEIIDDGTLTFDLTRPDPTWQRYDLVLERSISQSRGMYLLHALARIGVPTLNRYPVTVTCNDKYLTTATLLTNGIPVPQTLLAFTPATALASMESLGYPVVLKPPVGSWGRLLARINDRDAAEALLEHKETLGSYQHHTYYIQEYIPKPDRDIRAFVVGEQVICAIYRHAAHWVTNTARGATTTNCPITPELVDLCLRTTRAIAGTEGAILAIDLFESTRGLLVNEVNATMEFRNSITPTGIDIPGIVADYAIAQARMHRCKEVAG